MVYIDSTLLRETRNVDFNKRCTCAKLPEVRMRPQGSSARWPDVFSEQNAHFARFAIILARMACRSDARSIMAA